MYSLPLSIKIGDNDFKIRNKGDYRMVLDCFNALNDEQLSEEERVISSLIIFYEDLNVYEDLANYTSDQIVSLIKEMYLFMNCGDVQTSNKGKPKLIDWDKDSTMICSAINNVCHFEIRAIEYCHWWTFMGYFMSIGESTMSQVVGIRNKIVKGKKLEKYEKEFKQDNPEYFVWDRRSIQQKEDEEYIRNLWNSDK